MFFCEVKRKYFNIIFLLIIVVGGYWLYSAISPSATTDSYDVYKYSYYKPLSKEEFIYFNLTKDYEEGNTIAYSNIDDKQFWTEFTLQLNDTTKKYFLDVIKKMNPDYKPTEKMNDVTLDISYDEVKPYLEDLENKLNVLSFYYTGMYAPETYNEKYDMIDSPSPYWIYLECGRGIFSEEEYSNHRKDFELLFEQGISNGYAYKALDYIEILIGILSIVYSFQFFSEDKRANINGFIYTEKINSARHVLGKYFATIIPLMLLSFLYMLFVAGCFMYWNYKFKYGYNIDALIFLKQIPLIIFPSICIIVAISGLLGILIQNEIITAIFQFVIFYLSMSGVPDDKFSLNTMIRYSDFDDYSFYNAYLKYIPTNRFLMTVSSAVCICFVIVLFEYRKDHDKLLYWEYVRKILIKDSVKAKILNRDTRKSVDTKCLLAYIIRQSVHISALLYILYLCLMYPIVTSKNMDASAIATIGENIIIFVSLFLFIRLGNMEKANGMEEQVFTANTSYPLIYLARVCVVSLVLFVLVEVPLGALCIYNNVNMGRWCIGVYLSSLFIGLLSLLITEVLENSYAGYFVYIIYYFLDIVLKNGMFITLSGYTKGMAHTKIYIAEATILVLLVLTICVYLKMKGIRLTNRYGNKN